MRPGSDASKRILLDPLPRLLQGHGKTFAGYGPNYHAAVVVVCDLDRKCLHNFRKELNATPTRFPGTNLIPRYEVSETKKQ